jgi:nucleoid-associated protein
MIIKNVIVHYLDKKDGQKTAKVTLSKSLLNPNDEKTIFLLEKLNENYRHSEITYAIFDNAQGKVFPGLYSTYQANKIESEFIKFSQDAITNLRDIVINVVAAKGGFLIFAEYEIDSKTYIAIYLIRDTTGMLFEMDTKISSYVLNPIEHLDLDKLAMACKIDNLKFRGNNEKYLGFIKKRQNDISDYFINWIAAIETESNKDYTHSLLEIVNQLPPPLDERLNQISPEILRKDIFDYVKTSPDKTINLLDLGRHFYNNDTILVDFAESHGIIIDSEFTPDNHEMRKFVYINLESDGIHLNFSRLEYGTKVRLPADDPCIVIIESPIFRQALAQEIESDESE